MRKIAFVVLLLINLTVFAQGKYADSLRLPSATTGLGLILHLQKEIILQHSDIILKRCLWLKKQRISDV